MSKVFRMASRFLFEKIITRKGLAVAIVIGIFLPLLYTMYIDLFVEEKEEIGLRYSAEDIVYRFTLKSFDYHNSLVRGDLELRLSEHFLSSLKNGEKYIFGPLVYSDGGDDFNLYGLRGRDWFEEWTSLGKAYYKGFSDQEPDSLRFEIIALGEPKLYPFDKYFLVGVAVCQIIKETDVGGKGRTINHERNQKTTVKQDIRGFLLRRARFNEVKGWGDKPDEDETEKKNFEKWNKGNTFLLVLERPLFLRFMAVFLGLTAFVSILFIVRLGPISDIPIKLVGYFVGLWALREVFSGGTEAFPTVIDYGTFLLYSILIVGVVVRIIWPKKPSLS